MNLRRSTLIFAASLFLAGCATVTRDDLSSRRQAYERLIDFIQPGMTRRQLYALLPPTRCPTAMLAHLSAVVGIPLYALHAEDYPLDEGFSIHVDYRLANLNEYPLPVFAPGRHHNPSIQALLTGPPLSNPSVASRQNPKDELATHPMLRGPGVHPVIIYFSQVPFSDLTISSAPHLTLDSRRLTTRSSEQRLAVGFSLHPTSCFASLRR